MSATDSRVCKHPSGIQELKFTALAGLGLATVMCLLGFVFGGRFFVEKTLTALVQPVGAIWLMLGAWTLQFLVRRRFRPAIVPGLVWILLTICSTGPLESACCWYLEVYSLETSGKEPFDLATEPPLEAVIVLGGGASEGPYRAEAGCAGDRIVYAAQLYHQGHTFHLYTSGDATPTISGKVNRSVSDLTTEIWTKLGIPATDISPLHGLNTYQEMQSIKEAMSTELAGKRVGLLTSAMHMPRALRLAQAQGIDSLIPVVADYTWSPGDITFHYFLPRADILSTLARCQHELMAGLVGR